MDWTGAEAMDVPVSGAVARILCSAHNSGLSPLDAGIEAIRDTFKAFFKASDEFYSKTSRLESMRFEADGILFERWLLKTTINGILSSPRKFGGFRPKWFETDLAFGRRPFDAINGMGLYSVAPAIQGQLMPRREVLTFRPLILDHSSGKILAGSLVIAFGFAFFLKVLPKTENISIRFRDQDLIDPRLHRKFSVGVSDNGRPSDQVTLKLQFKQNP